MTPQDDRNDETRSFLAITIGSMVSHYRIVEKIGAGGMGEVYLAEDTELDRKVALKFLAQQLCRDEECRTRFKREAQAAAKLNHPNIVTVHEVGDFQGRPFFAMEYVKGRALKEFIAEGSVSNEFAINVITQLCEGLAKAHAEGITHRDIKPSNIIIDADGRARLVDFGLASIARDEKITKTGSTLGTVGYMSPEQIKGDDADARSDLFSLGIVFYEMIAGRRPFEGKNEPATMNAILSETPEPLARYKSGVSDDVQRIVSKLLEKNPKYRYQSAAGVIADLKKLTDTGPVTPAKPVDWWNRYIVVGAVVILAIITILWLLGQLKITDHTGKIEGKKKMLVVLPFENLGDPNDEYFADGITDEITSKLGVVKGLGVISRTSAMQYKHTDKGLPQIAKELSVDYVLEGTIRWDKSGDTDVVRITPQLIKASDNTHIWAGNYQRPLKSVFAVQSEIATQIVDALDVTLLKSEQQTLDQKPTENLDAYEYYLRASDYWDHADAESAIRLLNKAIAADENYAKAYALLVQIRGYNYINSIDRSKENVEAARRAADQAINLAAGKVEGYLARGYFDYYIGYDYDRALENFEKALQDQPNNSELLSAIGYVKRRQGKWDEAVASLLQAVKLNPFDVSILTGLGTTYTRMHELEKSLRVADDGLELIPDEPSLLLARMVMLYYIEGRSPSFQEAFEKVNRLVPQSISAPYMERGNILFRDYESALKCQPEPGIFSDTADYYLSRADIYHLMDRDSISRCYYDSARVAYEAFLKTRPDDPWMYMNLSIALAGVGRKGDAIQYAKHAIDLVPLSKDALKGANALEYLADVYRMVGEYDLAIDQLDTLLRIPSNVQVEVLRNDPEWDVVRDNPRFQALLAKYASHSG
jgi:TolB-like protein/predicted Ser/Thr protein kinase